MNRKKNKLIGYYIGIGLGIIIVTAFLTSQIFMPIFFGRPKTVEIPNVVNLGSGRAKNLLNDMKLHSIVSDSTWSDEIERGFVIAQKPGAGQFIKPDGTVYLEVSKGSRYIKVPELAGLSVQAAWIALRNNSLKLIVADSVYSDLYPRSTVVRALPDVGSRVMKNSVIQLYISKGLSDSLDTEQIDSLPADYNY